MNVLVGAAALTATAPCLGAGVQLHRPALLDAVAVPNFSPLRPEPRALSPSLEKSLALRGGADAMEIVVKLLKTFVKILTAPLWFFDKVDKEAFVLSIPLPIRKQLLRIMFWPTLWWTILLHNLMPDKRRWYDRVDPRVIIGALPLKRHLEMLARVERVTGIINFCDEFGGHAEYERVGMRQLRLPTLDYCSPTAQQLEAGLDFIRRQPPGASVYVHCKAGRGRAGTMLMAYLIEDKGLNPQEAQEALSAARPHVSPRLWKRPSVRELHRRVQQRTLMRAQQAAQAEAANQQRHQQQQAAAAAQYQAAAAQQQQAAMAAQAAAAQAAAAQAAAAQAAQQAAGDAGGESKA